MWASEAALSKSEYSITLLRCLVPLKAIIHGATLLLETLWLL